MDKETVSLIKKIIDEEYFKISEFEDAKSSIEFVKGINIYRRMILERLAEDKKDQKDHKKDENKKDKKKDKDNKDKKVKDVSKPYNKFTDDDHAVKTFLGDSKDGIKNILKSGKL
jgi:hypothetical protein